MALRLDVRPAEPLRARVAVEARSEATPEPTGSRDVYWPEHRAVTATPVFTGGDIPPGTVLVGPALVDYPDTTVVLRPDLRMVVEPGGNLTIELED
jgi:N-methylhydantoinase A